MDSSPRRRPPPLPTSSRLPPPHLRARRLTPDPAPTDEFHGAGWSAPERIGTTTPGGVQMSQIVLLVGTRKGLFILESDADRKDWNMRGPLCEGWPIYNAVLDPATGAIYASAASEWHGAGVWRSTDFGETWTFSSDGFVHSDPDLKLNRVTGLTAAHGRVLAGTEAAGIFES